MTDELTQRLDLAQSLMTQAGALAMTYFAHLDTLAVERKANAQDTVSRADREVEVLLRAALSDAFPDDAFLGEEGGGADGISGWMWAIDPIDGTANFLHGLTEWAISVGVLYQGEAMGGVIFVPCRNELFRGAIGQGATLNDQPIAVTATETLQDGLMGIGINLDVDPAGIGRLTAGLLSQGRIFVRSGSAATALAHVAAGRCVGYYEAALRLWDCAAGIALIRAAGGDVMTHHPQSDLPTPGPILACAPQVTAPCRALIAQSELPL